MQGCPSIQENLLKRKKETRLRSIQVLSKRIVILNSSGMPVSLIMRLFRHVHIYNLFNLHV